MANTKTSRGKGKMDLDIQDRRMKYRTVQLNVDKRRMSMKGKR